MRRYGHLAHGMSAMSRLLRWNVALLTSHTDAALFQQARTTLGAPFWWKQVLHGRQPQQVVTVRIDSMRGKSNILSVVVAKHRKCRSG